MPRQQLLTATLYRNGFPRLIDSDKCKDTVCDAKLLAGHVTCYPYFYRNRHGGPPDPFYSRITSNRVPYPHRLEERHPFHRHGNDARFRSLRRKNSAAQVHLRGQPSPENVAIWIGVRRHRNRLNNQLASGLLGHLRNLVRHSERSRGIPRNERNVAPRDVSTSLDMTRA